MDIVLGMISNFYNQSDKNAVVITCAYQIPKLANMNYNQKMKWLITGGLGYIGSHLAIELKKNLDCEVILVDNLSSGKKSRNILNLDFEILDIRDQDSLNKLFQRHKFDGIFHLAASKSVEESVDFPEKFFDNNVVATLILLETARKFQVRNFIFASSCAVYGDFFVSETGVDEKSDINPTNYYGETKALAERLIQMYAENFSILIFRFFNVIGAASPDLLDIGSGSLFGNLVSNHLNQKEFKIFGKDFGTPDGTAIRDFIDVRDIARALRLGLEKITSGSSVNEVYNIGTNQGVSVLEFTKCFFNELNLDPGIKFVERRKGDVPIIFSNSLKICRDLGFTHEFSLRKSIKDASYFKK